MMGLPDVLQLFDSTLRVSVILGAALGVAFLLRRRSAALRHWVLSLAIAGALVAPMMTLVAPAWRPGFVDHLMRPFVAGGAAETPADARIGSTETLRLLTRADEATSASASASADARNPAAAAAASPRSALNAIKRALTSGAPIIMPVWIAGVILFTAVLLTGLARLRWLSMRSRRVSHRAEHAEHAERSEHAEHTLAVITNEIAAERGINRPITLLSNDRTRLLVTWGYFRPRVMLPACAAHWPQERLRIVLSHELAHVRRGDWGTQLAAEILRALFWFNPLVWIVCRRLRIESELACDDDVLNGGVNGADYAGHLLDLARVLNSPRHAWLSAPAMARPSSLEGRISAMLNAGLNRHPVSRAARAATGALVLALTLAVAGFAQSTFYTFSGTVLDSTDRFVPGATLALTNASRGARYEIRSDPTGRFEFIGLPAGDYEVEAKLPGFEIFKDKISITNANVDRRITLQLGSLTETISVRGPGAPAGTPPTRHGYDDATIAAMREKVGASCTASPSSVGGNIKAPSKVKDVRPVYPAELSAANIAGTVAMEATISTGGLVENLTVISAPDPGLAAAATEAVRQWEYTPTLLNCTPVEAKVGITVSFAPKE